MNIIVAGCGKIGTGIIASLVSEGHDVVAIDNNQEVVSDISNTYDVMTVCGDITDRQVLMEAGVENARLFVAVTDSDEQNMLSSFIARRMGAHHTVPRVRNPKYSADGVGFLRDQLKLSFTINPEKLVAREIYNILKFPSAIKIEKFSSGNFEMMEVCLQEGSKLEGLTLSELRNKFKANFLVCAVSRDEKAYIPDGNFVLQGGDRIGITATPSELHKLFKQLGILRKQAKNVMILGAGTTSYYLAKMLTATGSSVKVIEKDENRCKEFAHTISQAVVINGDGAQQELLREEGIGQTDAFVSLTGTDEQNILISCFAATENVSKVITKINRNQFYSIAARLGLDCIITPKNAVSDVVVSYARALQNSLGSKVDILYKLMDGSVEAIEFLAGSDFKYSGITLKDMVLKNNTLIAGIIRGRKSIIPSGSDTIMPGDKVIVITAGHRLNDLSDIIK